MDEGHTKQTLDALGDLFLTNSVPSAPATQKSEDLDHASALPVDNEAPMPIRLVPQVTHENNVYTLHTSVGTTPAPSMTLRYRGEDRSNSSGDEKVDGPDSDELAMHVEAVMLGNLPVLSRPWLSQYAHQLAADRGPVAVLHVDSTRIDLELICTTDQNHCIGLADSIDTADSDQARRNLPALLDNLANTKPMPVRTWLVHLPSPHSAAQMARALPLRRWTLLSGGDDAAVAAAHQQLKRILETDGSPEQRQVGLALMGSDECLSASVKTRLNETVGQMLHMPIELKCTLKQMLPVRQHILGSFPDAQSLWSQILHFFQSRAEQELISMARRTPDEPITRTAVHTAQTSKPRMPLEQAEPHPSPKPVEPPTVSRTIQAEPDLKQLLAIAHPSSVALEASCPHQPRALLALDEHGAVHILLYEVGTSPEAVRTALLDLITTQHWVTQHLTLLQLTQRQCQFDMTADSVIHLFTDQAKTATALLPHLDPQVRMHLLQRIAIGDQATWHCIDIN